MMKNTTRADPAESNSDILRFSHPGSPQPSEVHLSIDSDAVTISFEHVSHGARASKLTIGHNGTWLVGRLSMAFQARDGEAGVAQAFATADGYRAG